MSQNRGAITYRFKTHIQKTCW